MTADTVPAARFDASWRARCAVSHIGREQAAPMVRAHYLGRWPGVPTCTLGMWDGPFLVGILIFALPPAQTHTRYGAHCWELARLWVADTVPSNAETWFIGQAVKHVRREHPEVACLVSYADPSAGHAGTIYKAANWQRDGRTDDERKTARCDYVWQGKKYSRQGHLPPGAKATRVPRVSKYRFIYRLRVA